MLDRTLPPAYHPVTDFKLLKPLHIPFPNGVQTFVFNAGDQDLVRIEWIFGNVFAQEDQSLLNSCASELLLEGTTKYSSKQIAELVDFHGAFLVPEYGYDQSALTLFSLNKHLDQLLPLVKNILTDAIFPERELATYIRNNKQKLQVSLKKNSFVARRLFNKTLFGPTRYGYIPDVPDYDRIAREALLALFKQQYTPANCTLIVSGKVTDGVIDALRQLFGDSWQLADKAIPVDPAPKFAPTEGLLVVDERKDALQSAIRLGSQSIQRSHPDFPGLQVLNTLLGGYFGSRLMTNIREEKGYTYSIGSGLASLRHSAFFTISSEVGVAVTKATLAEIEKEIQRLREEPVEESELALVKNYLMGSMLGSLENVFSHADKFKTVYFSGLGLEYYDYYSDTINSITAEEIARLANTYLNYQNMIKVIVGKYES
ncbi:insulinase family protein [Parapedobacter sp. ISTM3]|uniref:Predicted Zn-dependent peptidase n=1 Tax=Parapedobacter luteus TaxID=623280 RepID=A0A1T5AVL6_9SPHI|nr:MULTISPECIES: pitrilysin family protein [Parapedobacter]MBK1440278.1 insulinase family protein [Parapedobacter sp. ISTM3]SKB39022.1 Predicted Zn-dependent peptidase [Parapedobacter luteus]